LGSDTGIERKIPESYYAGRHADHSQCIPGSRIQTMKLNYFPETDSLYIDLSERPSSESKVISEGVVLDYDSEGNLVGIDIDNASSKVEMEKLVLSKLPGKVETVAA